MGQWAEWLITAVGAAVVLVALRDIFHTLWHPSGRGDLSHLVMRAVWRLGQWRRGRGQSGVVTGPVALVAVLLLWLAMIVVGGALVYGPHLPEGFVYAAGLDTGRRSGPVDAVYLSMVTVATLGFGDIVPSEGWLRFAVPIQALIGFAFLTATVTWVLQIYPALIRRRAFAVRLSLLRREPLATLLSDEDSVLAVRLLDGLVRDLVAVRVDVTQYPETYYFRDGNQEASLPAMVGVLVDLAAAGHASPRKDARVTARLLDAAIDDFAAVIDEQFLHRGGATDDILAAYSSAHQYRRLGAGGRG